MNKVKTKVKAKLNELLVNNAKRFIKPIYTNKSDKQNNTKGV